MSERTEASVRVRVETLLDALGVKDNHGDWDRLAEGRDWMKISEIAAEILALLQPEEPKPHRVLISGVWQPLCWCSQPESGPIEDRCPVCGGHYTDFVKGGVQREEPQEYGGSITNPDVPPEAPPVQPEDEPIILRDTPADYYFKPEDVEPVAVVKRAIEGDESE